MTRKPPPSLLLRVARTGPPRNPSWRCSHYDPTRQRDNAHRLNKL
jgi:hypothetical protein